MPQLLGIGTTFIFKRFKVRVTGITRHGVRVIKVNKNHHTLEIPFDQLPKKFR